MTAMGLGIGAYSKKVRSGALIQWELRRTDKPLKSREICFSILTAKDFDMSDKFERIESIYYVEKAKMLLMSSYETENTKQS